MAKQEVSASPSAVPDGHPPWRRRFCPPTGRFAKFLFAVQILLVFLGFAWGLTEGVAPWKTIYSLVFLLVLAHLFGWVVGLIRLPPLLGMLVAGFALKNIPGVNAVFAFSQPWSAALRTTALVIILVRAGMGLDPAALKRLSLAVLRLAFLPCLVETCVIVLVTHFFLDLPVVWGFVLGFVLAAVSPAVVVPSMIWCQERRLGIAKGIPTLVIAAASIDDVLAITGFSIALGIAFDPGNSIAFVAARGPIEVLIGVGFGVTTGMAAWYLPENLSPTSSSIVASRFLLLLLLGLFSAFVFEAVEFAGAGALGALTSAFVANLGWRRRGWNDDEANPVSAIFGFIWRLLAQPLLFGLIGAEVRVMELDGRTVGVGIGCLAISLVCRMAASILAVLGTEMNLKEKIFIPLAWLPKATVQAAIGAVAYDQARGRLDSFENSATTALPSTTNATTTYPTVNATITTPITEETLRANVERGQQVLTLAVLAILITAPLGATMITLTAPKLLEKGAETRNGFDNLGAAKSDPEVDKKEEEQSGF